MKSSTARVGYVSSIVTSLLVLITFAIAIATPPLSGPLCAANCIAYPFADAITRFPRDYLWMYPAILLFTSYVVFASAHYLAARDDRKIYALMSLAFALFASLMLISNYFVQLSVVQPSLMNAELDGVALISQFNSHGIFIALEELGFFMMSISSLWLGLALVGQQKTAAMRWTLMGSFFATLMAFVVLATMYRLSREYRFEIAAISINWIVLFVVGTLSVPYFKKML